MGLLRPVQKGLCTKYVCVIEDSEVISNSAVGFGERKSELVASVLVIRFCVNGFGFGS